SFYSAALAKHPAKAQVVTTHTYPTPPVLLRHPTPASSLVFRVVKRATMRVVVQRVKRASVAVEHKGGDGTSSEPSTVVSEIGKGILCLVGVKDGDEKGHAEWLCKQIVTAKLFEGMSEANADKRWRSNVKQNGFEILLVSQARY
ncbi:unnamed protein product, partial [Ectocarpus sp. 8 AP-2014]